MLGILTNVPFGKLILNFLDNGYPGCSRGRVVLFYLLLCRLNPISDFTNTKDHIGYCESDFPELAMRMEKHDWFCEIELIVADDLHDSSYDNVYSKNLRY